MANPNPVTKHLKRTAGPGRPPGSKNKLTRERVEQELRVLAFTNTAAASFAKLKDPITGKLRNVFSLKEVHEMPEEVQRCIASIKTRRENLGSGDGVQDETVEIRWWDKVKALELCGRALGLFKDKVELTISPEAQLSRLDKAKARARGEK